MTKDKTASVVYKDLLDNFNKISEKTDNMTKTVFRTILLNSMCDMDYGIEEII